MATRSNALHLLYSPSLHLAPMAGTVPSRQCGIPACPRAIAFRLEIARAPRAVSASPEDLVREMDSLVGSRGRSNALVETAREAIRRRKLLQVLNSKEAVWKDARDQVTKGPPKLSSPG